jgi:hypothetical protein
MSRVASAFCALMVALAAGCSSSDSMTTPTGPTTPPATPQDPPALTASVERAALGAGEITRLAWRASGTSFVLIEPIRGLSLPAAGSLDLTPCPGVTEFDVGTHNLSGEAHVRIPVTVSAAPSLPWYCGTWSGPSTETWTDSGGQPGSWAGGVTISAFQSAGRVTGYVWRDLPMHGLITRPLDARASPGGRLAATIPATAAGFPNEAGPRFACPLELRADSSLDGATLTGTFSGRCTLAANREVTLEGRFDATRDPNPYPRPYQTP